MKIAFMIWSAVAIVLIVIGAMAYRSETPAGFYSNYGPPEVRDVHGYNQAVARMWWTAALLFEAIGGLLLKVRQNSPLVILPVLLTVAWAIGLLLAYHRIEAKYRAD